MKKIPKFLHSLVAVVFLLSMLGTAVQPAQAGSLQADRAPRKAYPALLEMAKQRPNETVRIIVQTVKQRTGRKKDMPEQTVANAGGRISKRLRIVNGMVVEVPARVVETLAKNPNVRWISLDAPLRSSMTVSAAMRDEFTSSSFENSQGTASWATPWWENDPLANGAGPLLGQVQVVNGALRLDDAPDTGGQPSAARIADLSSASSATLTFNYATSVGVDPTDVVVLEISSNGGNQFTVLDTFVNILGASSGNRSYDISSFISSSTTIRFRVSSYYGVSDEFFTVDNLEISYSRDGVDTTKLAGNFIRDIGADRLWNRDPSLQGEGITVAVVDSGISNHGDFSSDAASRLIGSVNFSSVSYNADDENGHGTHVAGIIASNGSLSSGAHMGVAPEVNLLNVKVSNADGMSYTSDLINALQWIYDNQDAYNIRVVNLSLNSSVPEPYHLSPLDAAVEILWFNGIVVVVSAGNNGNGTLPVDIFPPANDPFVITVGAADDFGTAGISDDVVAHFSAFGTTEDGFTKPEIVAPGRFIVSALSSPAARLNQGHPKHFVAPQYFRMSGTSMAAPMVAGAAALLLQDQPHLTPDQVKYRLLSTANANWVGYDPLKAGAGYLDAYEAVHGTTVESANVGVLMSELLWSGSDTVSWGSVSWNSVSWNSVSWNSVSWNSVSWNSVSWNSNFWDELP